MTTVRPSDGILEAAQTYVKEYMSRFDPSHDWLHVDRVRRLALHIAGKKADAQVVELAALFHDIADAKYAEPGQPKVSGDQVVISFLTGLGYPQERAALVGRIIDNVSFSKELGWSNEDDSDFIQWRQNCLELHAVQDADKLDAIGAFGILRCAAYSGAKGRSLYVPDDKPMTGMTQEQYMEQSKTGTGSAVNHFHEKLFRLKDMMKTEIGRTMAQERDAFMRLFIEQVNKEARMLT